jgi:hypothetical protein
MGCRLVWAEILCFAEAGVKRRLLSHPTSWGRLRRIGSYGGCKDSFAQLANTNVQLFALYDVQLIATISGKLQRLLAESNAKLS